ncbi:hypothetical protein [Martelella alba]|uniref:Uncharacterized protein n=1 Tax=Martelella alba TaxID=2590451 RepID=A0ABY2SE76_9HYPH|nr:hypothetical protein [Martelella alba]TKI02069.1 hypothetical protein FCN80_25865 [Martelella alba]
MCRVNISCKNQCNNSIINELYEYLKNFSSSHEDFFPHHVTVSKFSDGINFPENYEKPRKVFFKTKIRFRLNENFSLKNLSELLLCFFQKKNVQKTFNFKCESFSDLKKIIEIKTVGVAVDLGVL